MAYKTNRTTGNVFQVADYQARIDAILKGRDYRDLPPYEKARVNFIMDSLQRERRREMEKEKLAGAFEKRSMATEADISRNRELIQARKQREQLEGLKPHRVKTKLRYNDAEGKWELVQE